jgi:hypothetical protein
MKNPNRVLGGQLAWARRMSPQPLGDDERDTVTPLPSVTVTPFRCPRCERIGVRAQGVVAPICEACRKAWGGK